MLSLQDLQGDNKVVNIIEDWDVLEEYAGEKLGFYQILAIEEHVKSEHNSERMVSRESLWRRFVDPFLNRILNFKSNCAQKKQYRRKKIFTPIFFF